MPRAQVPGPVGLDFRWHAFDRGTLALAPHAPPGPVGLELSAQVVGASTVATAMAVDVEAAIREIHAIALPDYRGRCAQHVRKALEAGGAVIRERPLYAKDYGRALIALGFRGVIIEPAAAERGDVAVFQDYPGQKVPAGHIQMFDGKQWVSDTVQPRFLAHRIHYNGIPYVIYRP